MDDEWKSLKLSPNASVARVCGIYEIQDVVRLPSGKYKVKVLERGDDFLAVANLAVKAADGSPDWISGMGSREIEALQDLVTRLGEQLATKAEWLDEELAWADPQDF